eukprot:2214152-Pyramimonas_sp.AAC.2
MEEVTMEAAGLPVLNGYDWVRAKVHVPLEATEVNIVFTDGQNWENNRGVRVSLGRRALDKPFFTSEEFDSPPNPPLSGKLSSSDWSARSTLPSCRRPVGPRGAPAARDWSAQGGGDAAGP